MADVKITNLAAYTDPVSTDVLPIVDVGSDITKKVSIADLLENAGTGSAAAPSFSFDGDNNTGIYRPGADQLAISTNGTGRLYINSSGNVGIGTSSPDSFLDISVAKSPTRPALSAGNLLLLESTQNSTAYTSATILGGNSSGASILNLGDVDDADAGEIFYSHSNNSMLFKTNGAERLRIDSSGRVGIGSSSPIVGLDLNTGDANASIRIRGTSDSPLNMDAADSGPNYVSVRRSGTRIAYYGFGGSGDDFNIVNETSTGPVSFATNSTERLRIDSSGRLLVGTSTARSNFDSTWGNFTPSAQFETNNNTVNGLSVVKNSVSGYPAELSLAATKDAAIGGNSIVGSSQRIGQISFKGADGTNLVEAAEIRAEVDGTPGTNDMPGRLVFSTTADGASSPTERLRINSSGNVLIGGTIPSSPNIELNADGSAEFAGSVSIGGTAAANTIDEYEEGTWTPTVEGNTVAGTVTYNTNGRAGKYVRIGKVVSIEIYLDVASLGGATGTAKITGLPYNADNTNFGVGYMDMFATFGNQAIAAYTVNAQSFLYLRDTTGSNLAVQTGLIKVSGAYLAFA